MKKVELKMNEQNKYEIIVNLVEKDSNKNTAALKLGLSIRHINRLIIKYKERGKARFHTRKP